MDTKRWNTDIEKEMEENLSIIIDYLKKFTIIANSSC